MILCYVQWFKVENTALRMILPNTIIFCTFQALFHKSCLVSNLIHKMYLMIAGWTPENEEDLVTLPGGRVMCKRCDKSYSTMTNASRHFRENHRWQAKSQCQFCKKFYKNERRRNEHLLTSHGISIKHLKRGSEELSNPLKMEFEPEIDFMD